MKNYIDRMTGELFAYEDNVNDSEIRGGLEPISDEELAEVRAAQNAPFVLQAAYSKRDEFMALATLRIAPLQDAADLGNPTQEESAALLAWKQYRRDVNRVTSQSGFPATIDWPVKPA